MDGDRPAGVLEMSMVRVRHPHLVPSISGRQSIEKQMHQVEKDNRRKRQRSVREVSEFDVREGLRSWEIKAR